MKSNDKIFGFVVTSFMTLFAIATLYPMIILISSSFSDGYAIMSGKVILFPVGATIEPYKIVFRHPEIWGAYRNTIMYTLIGTIINITLTTLGAYPLSRPDLYGRNIFMGIIVFTMFFVGGMIPEYLLVRNLNLYNTLWAIVLPTSVSVWNLIIMRTFFQSNVPRELWESVTLDGANDLKFFVYIVLPLSAPIMAVMVLFYGVGNWNSWFSAMLYLSSRDRYPLQLILREIIIQSSTQDMAGASESDVESVGEGVKYATMMVATVPIMCLYPFLQRYFVKGVMVGALKG